MSQKGCISIWLVFSSEMSISKAVATSYLTASGDKLKDVGTFIREVVLKAFKSSKEMPWPPMIDNIEKMWTEKLTEELERFLNLTFSGNEPNTEKWEPAKRLVYSIGQDVCCAVSQGRWRLSEHILICASLRYLYRTEQLTIILNGLCHCKSYCFGLELETAMAKAIDEADTYYWTPQIVTRKDNLVFHSEWNNLNKTLTNVVTGTNVVKRAVGIMLHEQKKETTSSAKQPRLMLGRSKEQSLKPEQPIVTGLAFPEETVLSPPPANDTEYSLRVKEDLAWFLCR